MKPEQIEQLDSKQFAALFNEIVKRINEDPIENFIKARGFMNFTPTAPQEVIFKVIFQKMLDSTEMREVQIESKDSDGVFCIKKTKMTEVQIYEFLTDRVYDPKKIQEFKINKIDLILGRRSGKTLMSAIISILGAISINWRPFLSKTPFATVLIMSHSKEFSTEVFDVISELIKESPVLVKLINKNRKNTASAMNLSVPFIVEGKIVNSYVQIRVGAASSKTTRGIAAPIVLADEICWWAIDENMKETDAKIMKAVRPAMKQFGDRGILIKLSSPAIKLGVMYEEYKADRAGELPPSYAVFKAPSWVMNNILPPEEFVEEYLYDPEGFDVEYRANFANSLSNFISPVMLEVAIQKGVKFKTPSEDKSVKYFASIDAAFKSDRFTFSLVGVSENRITQYVSKGWVGDKNNPVKANDVAVWIRNAISDFPVDYVCADQFAFQPLREIFDTYGITLEERVFNPTYKKKIYFNLKNLVHRQQIDLLDSEKQNKEISELVVEQSTTGTVKIGHPSGGSDDYADSLAIACYEAVEGQSTGKFEFESMTGVKTHGILTDVNGVAFTAPSPEMLSMSGHLEANVIDNSESYRKDPDTGMLKHIEEFEDEMDAGPQFLF